MVCFLKSLLTFHQELVTGSKTPDTGVKSAMLRALHEVVSKGGANMSDASKQAVLSVVDDEGSERDGKHYFIIF